MPNSSQLFLGRQPILDREQQLVAYELLFRNGEQNFAQITDDAHATATVITNAFFELSLSDVLGKCQGFINIDEAFLFNNILEILPRQSVVLEILETVRPTPEVIQRCRDLKAMGFTLALDDVVQVSPEYKDLLELAEIIKVDIHSLDSASITRLSAKLVPLGKQLLAEKVDSLEQQELCLKLGYSLFQGYYFARPNIISGKKLQHSKLSIIKLLSLILSDAETAELEVALKHEPGLSVNLLRLTNAVGSGATSRITSLSHAITLLGRRQIQRWLQLLLFATIGTRNATNPLLQLAATRGYLLELLALATRCGDIRFADQAFMVGIMSLTPALTGQGMQEIVGSLGLDGPIQEALCESRGPLGILLQIAEQVEQGNDTPPLRTLAQEAGLQPRTISLCLTQAIAWANDIGQKIEATPAA